MSFLLLAYVLCNTSVIVNVQSNIVTPIFISGNKFFAPNLECIKVYMCLLFQIAYKFFCFYSYCLKLSGYSQSKNSSVHICSRTQNLIHFRQVFAKARKRQSIYF